MRYGSIYVATNTVTGEQYVGQTRQRVERRWKCHINTANSAVAKKYGLANAIVQYGTDAIKFEEIYAAFDADELDAAEMNYIEWMKPAYNIARGGSGHRSVDCSDRLKKDRSERMFKLWADPEWKAKQVSALRASNSTEANRAKMKSIQMLGTKARWAGHVKKEAISKQPRAKKVVVKRDKAVVIADIARQKWQPLYCPELLVTFLSGKHAAEYFNVARSNISQLVASKGKVKHMFTLLKVK